MKENARQGYFNGSKPPFGYQAVETERLGNRGRRKKQLALHEGEAAIVRRIYSLYLRGHEGCSLGIKEIAKHLNECGQTMRGKAWGIQKVHKILSSRTYMGEALFNVIDSKTHKRRPPSEWIRTAIPAIVDQETFERVRQRRESRAPAATPPRRLASPTLLTGLLRCGDCGGAMTLTTGKSGTYRYYKCTTRVNKGGLLCTSRNLPTEKVDALVLEQLCEQVLTPDRLAVILKAIRKLLTGRKQHDRRDLSRLQGELRNADEALNRLYAAIESGTVTLDETLERRMHTVRSQREAVLIEIAGLRRVQNLPSAAVLPSQIEAFSRVMRAKLQDRSSAFAKDYLHTLVDQITVSDGTATIVGSHAKLLSAIDGTKKGTVQVPSFIPDWRARRDSNSRPSGSKPDALSS